MATKKSPIKKKATSQPTPKPQLDQEQQEFFLWLDQQWGTNGDPNLLKQKLQETPQEDLKALYSAFQQEKQKGLAQQFKKGGMIDHLTKLLSFKKGGITTGCLDCDKPKVPVKKLKMKGVQVGTADIKTAPMKSIDIEAKPLIKKKK